MDHHSSCQEPDSVLINQFVLIDHDVLPPKPRAQPLQLDPTQLDARYYASICRQPLIRHTVSAVLKEYDMASDAPKAKKFALLCRSKQAIHDEWSILMEWERKRSREEYIIGQAENFPMVFMHSILNNNQNELEFRISRYKVMEMFWTAESKVSMQKRVEAEFHQWTQRQEADARDKLRRERAEAAEKLRQETTAAQLLQKQLADAAKREGFMESVRERARLTLQPEQEQAIEPTPTPTPTPSPRSSDVTQAQPPPPAPAPTSPPPRKNSLSPTATEFKPTPRKNILSPTAADFKPAPRKNSLSPTATEFQPAKPKPSLSPTAADFKPAPPKKPFSPTAPAFAPSAPAAPPTPCTLPSCRSRNVPGILHSQDQAWIYGAVDFLKLELRLRCLEATAADPFVKPEGYEELMGDRLGWREQLGLMERVDAGLRERLDGMDFWGLERYEKELVRRIGKLERESGSAVKEG